MRDFRHRIIRGDGMGYKIIYGDGPRRADDKAESGNRIRILTATCLLMFCILVRMFWPEGTMLLRDVVLPGEQTVTEAAFETFLSGIRTGSSFQDALTAFCTEVIHNGTGIAR